MTLKPPNLGLLVSYDYSRVSSIPINLRIQYKYQSIINIICIKSCTIMFNGI